MLDFDTLPGLERIDRETSWAQDDLCLATILLHGHSLPDQPIPRIQPSSAAIRRSDKVNGGLK